MKKVIAMNGRGEPMDLIERQAVLDTLDTYWKNEVDKIPKETGFEKLASMCDTILKYSNAIAKLIKHLSSAQPEPQWIPVKKKAHPDLPIRVQVQMYNGWIITAYYQEGEWLSVPDCGEPLLDNWIEAWRELPEP